MVEQSTGNANPEGVPTLAKQTSAVSGGVLENVIQKQEEELKRLNKELEENSVSMQHLKSQPQDKPAPANANAPAPTAAAATSEDDPDERSVFVKNVDFSADDAQLIEHFKECGEISRVTIRKNPHTQQPLGLAYIEFNTKESALKAKLLNESLFKGRQLTVMPKRKNIPGKARGGGFAGKSGNPMAMMMNLMRGMARGMGGRGGFRGRGGYRGGRGRGGGGPGDGADRSAGAGGASQGQDGAK